MTNGFSLTELLVVIAVLAIILVASVVVFQSFTKKTDLNIFYSEIISTLNTARNKTLASEESAQYGVYFDDTSSPHKYVLFKGSNYSSREISFDEVHNLLSDIQFSDISFNGSEVVFERLDGNTDNHGSIIIRSLANNKPKIIYVYSSGEISSFQDSESGSGRASDSRHVHFDLGWNITGADTLKFNFINASQIEQVAMADYFTSTSFDWADEFTVSDDTQEFRIHTHQLDQTTLLCIHRDRNEEKNTQEVYIYIIQSGVEKEIVHYDNDQSATAYKGNYVWNEMQTQ